MPLNILGNPGFYKTRNGEFVHIEVAEPSSKEQYRAPDNIEGIYLKDGHPSSWCADGCHLASGAESANDLLEYLGLTMSTTSQESVEESPTKPYDDDMVDEPDTEPKLGPLPRVLHDKQRLIELLQASADLASMSFLRSRPQIRTWLDEIAYILDSVSDAEYKMDCPEDFDA